MSFQTGISNDFSDVGKSVYELLFSEFFVILLAILLPVKSPIDSAVFLVALFEVDVLIASVVDFFTMIKKYLIHLTHKFLLIFLPMYLLTFLAKDKNL